MFCRVVVRQESRTGVASDPFTIDSMGRARVTFTLQSLLSDPVTPKELVHIILPIVDRP
jgi:hypothetical protein